MTQVIRETKGREYRLPCKHCGSVSQYNEFDRDSFGRYTLSHYEDCYDTMCVEYTCPVCGKHTSILERDLEKYNVDNLKTSDEQVLKETRKIGWFVTGAIFGLVGMGVIIGILISELL